MKTLKQCEVYFKDVFITAYQSKIEDAPWRDQDEQRYKSFFEALKWIYGEEFEQTEPTWRNEAINKFWDERIGD